MFGVGQQIGATRLADGTQVAFATSGDGPPLVYMPGWVSHLELGWALAPERAFYEALSNGRTLIRYDRPGTGLSDPAPDRDLLEVELEVVDAVAVALDLSAFDLLGTSLSAALAVRWAARRPETVKKLVLYGGWVDGRELATPPMRDHLLGLVQQHWGLGSAVLTDLFAPDADPAFRVAFDTHQRQSTSAAQAVNSLATCYAINVEDDLPRVRAETHVIHRRGDRAAPLAEGRRLADGITGATFTELEGRIHLPFGGDLDALIAAVRSALDLPPVRRGRARDLPPRQLEVAGLVAEGLSNRQIAQRLGITERSVESHVERIRVRLDFRSRAQVAAWYATNHL